MYDTDDIEFHENVKVKPRGWGFDTDQEFKFHRLQKPGDALFVKLKYDENTDPEDLRRAEATLKRRIYVRATHCGVHVEVRRGKNKDGIKGVWIHYSEGESEEQKKESEE